MSFKQHKYVYAVIDIDVIDLLWSKQYYKLIKKTINNNKQLIIL